MTRVSKRFAGLALTTVAAMSVLAACSSSSSSSASSPSSSSSVQLRETRGRRDAAHRRRIGSRPPRHGAVVLHRGLPARARLHQAAPELPQPPYTSTSDADWLAVHHPGPGHGDRGADGRQRRDHQRREDVHLPHQAGRRLEHHAGAAGHRRRTSSASSRRSSTRSARSATRCTTPARSPAWRRTTTRRPPSSPSEEGAADGREHRQLPEHAQHLRHHGGRLATLAVHADPPASDFIYMLAMPFASARPVEYDSYVPNSLQLDSTPLRRPVLDQLVRRRQVDHDGPQPGVEAVHRHAAARLREPDPGHTRASPPRRPSCRTCRPARRT